MAAFAAASEPPRNDGHSWPTVHGDLRRAGWYPAFPKGRLKVVWRHELWRELTGPRAEVIVGHGLAFLGTYAGTLRAWDARTGDERWRFEAGGPIGHSPMLADGWLYVGAADGSLHCLSPTTGQPRWTKHLPAGVWSPPLVHDGQLVIGLRDGLVLGLEVGTGNEIWRFQTGGPILGVPSLDDSGTRVIVPSEDLRLYALGLADGTLAWRSQALAGLSLRDYAPAIVGGLALVDTNPVADFAGVLMRQQAFLVERTGFQGGDERFIAGTAEDEAAERTAIVDYLRQHANEQTFHAVRLSDGAEPWIAPVLYTAGCHNPAPPPCYDPTTGTVYLLVRSAYSAWDGGGEVRPLVSPATLDVATGQTTLIHHNHAPLAGQLPGRPTMPWNAFTVIGDETQALSCAPGLLLSNHQGSIGGFELQTGLASELAGARDSYLGYYGPAEWGWEQDGGLEKAAAAGQPFALRNEWHGPSRAIAAVADGLVYYNTGSQIICLQRATP